jgi:hypothetical protein
MTSKTKYAVMILVDLEEIYCGDESGSGFCPVMGGGECSGNE